MIDKFSRKYAFLSNYYPVQILMDGLVYPSVEHAYQAAKTDVPNIRRIFASLPDPHTAKALGGSLVLRPDHSDRDRISMMQTLLEQKFTAATPLSNLLLGTGNEYLAEGNDWGDTFWGTVDGKGENHLGTLLMNQRAFLRWGSDYQGDTPTSTPKFLLPRSNGDWRINDIIGLGEFAGSMCTLCGTSVTYSSKTWSRWIRNVYQEICNGCGTSLGWM